VVNPVELSRERRLRWEACLNVRDVGGYPTLDNRRTRWGALVRADTLSRLTAAGQAALVDYGVRTVLDLRFPGEAARDIHPFREASGSPEMPVYVNVPVNSGRDPSTDVQVFAAFSAVRTRADGYAVDVEFNRVAFARMLTAMASAPPGGIVVHCHAGKDRTGIVVALTLALVGVPEEVIAEDYALTAAYLMEHYERLPDDALRRELVGDLEGTTAETMLATLGRVRERHGGAEAYLVGGGATAEDLAALRRRLTE